MEGRYSSWRFCAKSKGPLRIQRLVKAPSEARRSLTGKAGGRFIMMMIFFGSPKVHAALEPSCGLFEGTEFMGGIRGVVLDRRAPVVFGF